MVLIRAARWPEDEPGLRALDTSFTTDRVYRVRRGALSFGLMEEAVDPPLRKSYDSLLKESDRLRRLPCVVVAEEDGELIGVATVGLSTWNRRAQVEDFFVAPDARGRGVGRALVDAVVAFVRGQDVRCVWLETQNVNFPAVQFYRRVGFRLCGLDERLYDNEGGEGDEVALFFVLDL